MSSPSGFSLNWGHGLMVVILLFLAGMLGMLYVASRQTNEMVDDHYYQKELAYQGVIDAGKNLKALTDESLVSQTPVNILLRFPKGSYENLKSGTIEMQRNDESRNDLHLTLPLSGTATYEIPKTSLIRGLYKLKISWINDQVPYYFEENVFVDK